MEQEQINFTRKLQFVELENSPVAHSQAWGYTRLVGYWEACRDGV